MSGTQPEAIIQRASVEWLEQQGWECIRLGYDGLPDILAIRSHSALKQWDGRSVVRNGYGVKLPPGHQHRIYWPKGFVIPTGSGATVLALEFKTPVGRLNGRQAAILKWLEHYCTVAVPRSVEDVKYLLQSSQNGNL